MGKSNKENRKMEKGAYLSSEHKTRIFWDDSCWVICDPGSPKGAYINGLRCEVGKTYPLKGNGRILFYGMSDTCFYDDDSTLCLMLSSRDKKMDGCGVIFLKDLSSSADRPISIILGAGSDTFELKNNNGVRIRLSRNQQLMIDGNNNAVNLAGDGEEPFITKHADEMRLDIAVAPDEESASVTLHEGCARLVLSPPRVHLYLLAHLARMRISETHRAHESLNSDKAAELDDYGWIDCKQLCRDLRIEPGYLTQQVFRIRQDFRKLNFSAAEKIIDRRLRGRMRIGFPAGKLTIGSLG